MMEEEEEELEKAPEEEPIESTERVAAGPCPIVGIGCSAGGVDALRRLFPKVEPGCGMSFVVVQHLDPDHGSMLAEVLSRCTQLPVRQIEGETDVEPEHVYVIPPNASLTIRNGRLHVERPRSAPGARGTRNVVDEFLTSLAEDQGENAACVILSGTGSDGTVGLRAIKERGGLTLAQSEAEYDGMMRSAVATGLVDFVLRIDEIPAKLTDYFRHVTESDNQFVQSAAGLGIADRLGEIATILRAQTGHDFSKYKDRTLIRRVQRRMNVLQVENLSDFIDLLRSDSGQVTLLFHDLLIGVTNFFRDPKAFAALEREVIPNLFPDKAPDEPVRAWVPGCATGEEAYSIAILLREGAPKADPARRLLVFATDIDDNALNTARAGRYPATIAKDVPEHLLQRYFVREDGTYRIASDLRDTCLFSSHNLLRDAPFSKLDLISCRNLLIYLSSELQDQVIPLFHYALAPNGYLFLGTSENVTRHSRLFATIDKTNRIFRRRAILGRRIPEFPLTAAPDRARRSRPAPPPRPGATEPSLKTAVERQILDRFAPAYVLINAEGDVLHASSRTGKYLELPAGAPETNIFHLARPGLRLDLRAVLHRAIGSGQLAMAPRVVIGTNGGRQEIDLSVHPMRYGAPPEMLYLVVFQDLGGIKASAETADFIEGDEVEKSNVHQLEAELRVTKERLQTTTEELESSNEELKSSNEELQSINEELQSANEELETSKEELQSINEELQTVNSELNARVDELSRANNDMSNLLESTQIATVFLDRGLNVKRFTPAAKDLFHLVESDAGRPITHVRPRFASETMQEDAERVLRALAPIERRVSGAEDERRYIMRTLPYRTTENVINGVVMTFTDITQITQAETKIEELTHDLRARISELETILDLVPVGLMFADSSPNREVLINAHAARLIGVGEHRGLKPAPSGFRLLDSDGELASRDHPLARAAREGAAVTDWQGRLQSERGGELHVMMSATPLFGEAGQVRGAVAAIVDISAHKQAEARQQFLLGELQHRVKNILATVASLAARMSAGRRSVEEFRSAFLARIGAMSRTHDLLTAGAWGGASLLALLKIELEPYATDRKGIRLNGPDVKLSASAAASLGMVFNELATNAAKYGALSQPNGRLEIEWALAHEEKDGKQRLRLTWSEHGGPPVQPLDGKGGFGLSFIARCVEYELGGKADLQLLPEGARFCMEFPLADSVEKPPPVI